MAVKQMNIASLEGSWKDLLSDEFQKDYFLKLKEFLEKNVGNIEVSLLILYTFYQNQMAYL